MSYALAIDSLARRYEALTPEWDADHTFASLDDGSGVALEDVPDPTSRLFSIRLRQPPADDGSSGFVWGRWRAALEVAVLYEETGDRARRDRVVASDAALIVSASIHPALPLPWHSSIDTVEPSGPPTLEALPGPESRPRAHLLRVPLTLVYRHEPNLE